MIITSLREGGGSGKGNSYYSTANRCGHKARLQAEQKLLGDDGIRESTYQLLKGTATHAQLEAYYRNVDVECALTKPDELQAWADAALLTDAYMAQFPREEAGRFVEAEIVYPNTEATIERIRGCFLEPYTIKPDLVTYADDATIAGWRSRGIYAPEEGLYLWDHKSAGSNNKSADELGLQLNEQFLSYLMTWNICNPDRPAKGLIVNKCVQTMTKPKDGSQPRPTGNHSFYSLLVMPPNLEEQEAIIAQIQRDARAFEAGEMNRRACVEFNRVCIMYTSGLCRRV